MSSSSSAAAPAAMAKLSFVTSSVIIIINNNNKLCGRPPQYAPALCDLDLRPFDLESGVQVTCDVGYRCANFSLPRPLCSLLRPDVRDRQTDGQTSDRQTSDLRQHHRLMPPPPRRGHNNERIWKAQHYQSSNARAVVISWSWCRIFWASTQMSGWKTSV